jgi:hypothetical protein
MISPVIGSTSSSSDDLTRHLKAGVGRALDKTRVGGAPDLKMTCRGMLPADGTMRGQCPVLTDDIIMVNVEVYQIVRIQLQNALN